MLAPLSESLHQNQHYGCLIIAQINANMKYNGDMSVIASCYQRVQGFIWSKIASNQTFEHGSPNWKLPELLFEKKQLIPAFQQ